MESIGEKLKTLREAKKLTIKDVAKETNITATYIEALENEEFDKFPGETYIIGFIRSYAEFLKVDSEEIIQAYKGYKIGESITPLEELTKPTRPGVFVNLSSAIESYKNIVFAVGGIVVVVILLVVYSVFSSTGIDIEDNNSIAEIKQEYQEDNPKDNFNKIINLKLNKDKEFTLVNRNEAVQFLVDSKEVMFVLRELNSDEVIIQTLPDKKYETLKINTPAIITVAEITREISLTLKGLTENSAKIMVELGKVEQSATPEQPVVKAPENATTADTTSVLAQNKENLKIVFEAEFVGPTYIDLYLDGQQKTKGLVQAGRRETWEASEFIQVKIGNAGGLKARINGKKYTFGKPGQVANKVITWKKDIKNPNLYHLVVKESK